VETVDKNDDVITYMWRGETIHPIYISAYVGKLLMIVTLVNKVEHTYHQVSEMIELPTMKKHQSTN
jgi:hypothetical protein